MVLFPSKGYKMLEFYSPHNPTCLIMCGEKKKKKNIAIKFKSHENTLKYLGFGVLGWFGIHGSED